MKKFLKWLAILIVLAVAALFIWGYAPDTDAAEMKAKYGGETSRYVELEP